ncbi:unnamed protein product, partial [Symbiodinium sp. KB8]
LLSVKFASLVLVDPETTAALLRKWLFEDWRLAFFQQVVFGCYHVHVFSLRNSFTSVHAAVPVFMPESPDYSLRHATGKGGLLGWVSENVAEERHVTISVGSAGQGERKEAGGKGLRGCKGEECKPAQHKSGSARRPLCRGRADQRNAKAAVNAARCAEGAAQALLRAKADKLSGLGTPAPTNLWAKHHKPTAAPARKFWVCPGFSTFSDTQSCNGAATVSAWHASCGERRHRCVVNGKLHTAPWGQAVRDDFYASFVLADGDNMEITHKDVHRNSCARLPAYSGSSSFEWAITFMLRSISSACQVFI